MTPTFFNAVQILTNQSAISGKTDGPIEKINFKEGFSDLPTEEQIQAKLAELQADYNAKQYQRDRKYPNLGEQFDLLFKDINEGTLDKTGGFYTAIKAVKDAHPKPSE